MNIFDLISSVGGTLGLFIGVSFLILFELLEIILESFLTKPTNINKKEKKIWKDLNLTSSDSEARA